MQELEQIPLFMTKTPDVVDPAKSPGLAALQDLKYQEGTPTGMSLDRTPFELLLDMHSTAT